MVAADQQLAKYCERWRLTDPIALAETQTSSIFKAITNNEIIILKLLKPAGINDEKNGAATLRYFGGHGAVSVLEQSDDAVLLEYADGSPLSSLVKEGQDCEATEILVDVLKKLHAQRPSSAVPSELYPLTRWFRSLWNDNNIDRLKGHNVDASRTILIARQLLDEPQQECVLHGDMHHDNVLFSAKRGWLAIDPKGLYGERTFDFVNILCNPYRIPALVADKERLMKTAQQISELSHINIYRILQFAYVYSALSACWSFEDNQDPSLALAVNKIVDPYIG